VPDADGDRPAQKSAGASDRAGERDVELLADRSTADEPDCQADDATPASDHERSQHSDHHDLADLTCNRQWVIAADDQSSRRPVEDPIDSVVELQIARGLGGVAPLGKIGDDSMQRVREL
jgi:hypothetical protein